MSERSRPPRLKPVSREQAGPPKKLTEAQREALSKWVSMAFVFLRSPGYAYHWDKEEDWHDVDKLQHTVDCAVALGEVFHNVPYFFVTEGFDFDLQERLMLAYAERFPIFRHLIAELREIRDMK